MEQLDSARHLEVAVTDHIATVSLNRPESLNAINTAMFAELAQVFAQLEDESDVWLIILTGNGRAFSVGADLKERQEMTLQDVRRRRRLAPVCMGAIANCQKPTIAAIHGYALGGGLELALCCDLLVAAEGTVMGLPETALGVIPGGGATQKLPRMIGPQLAKEIIFTGRRFTAEQALAYGILNRVAPANELMTVTLELSREITANAPVAVYQAKRAMNAALSIDLSNGLLFEAEAYATCLYSEDRNEGLAAKREKRKPRYQGK